MTLEQWTAIRTKDRESDGKFYFRPLRSHTVCRPSCLRRTPDASEIIIYDSLEEAYADGCTPCRYCHPEIVDWKGPKYELAEAAEKLILEHYNEKFSLSSIASLLHVDKSYLLRTFKEVKNETMLQCHNRIRCEKAKELLKRPELSISFIAAEVGFVSSSHFSHVFGKTTGMTPSQFRVLYFKGFDAPIEPQ